MKHRPRRESFRQRIVDLENEVGIAYILEVLGDVAREQAMPNLSTALEGMADEVRANVYDD